MLEGQPNVRTRRMRAYPAGQERSQRSNRQEVEVLLLSPELHAQAAPEGPIGRGREPMGERKKSMHLDRKITIGRVGDERSRDPGQLAQEVSLLFEAANVLQNSQGHGEVELPIIERQAAPVGGPERKAGEVRLEYRAILDAAGGQAVRMRVPPLEKIVVCNREVRSSSHVQDPAIA